MSKRRNDLLKKTREAMGLGNEKPRETDNIILAISVANAAGNSPDGKFPVTDILLESGAQLRISDNKESKSLSFFERVKKWLCKNSEEGSEPELDIVEEERFGSSITHYAKVGGYKKNRDETIDQIADIVAKSGYVVHDTETGQSWGD